MEEDKARNYVDEVKMLCSDVCSNGVLEEWTRWLFLQAYLRNARRGKGGRWETEENGRTKRLYDVVMNVVMMVLDVMGENTKVITP